MNDIYPLDILECFVNVIKSLELPFVKIEFLDVNCVCICLNFNCNA